MRAPAPEAITIERITGLAVLEWRSLGGSHGAAHYRCRLADGRELFVKSAYTGEGGAELAAEANGLHWLGRRRNRRHPRGRVLRSGFDGRRLDSVRRCRPRGGRASSDATWPACTPPVPTGSVRRGPGSSRACRCRTIRRSSWPTWYAEHRLLPYARLARDAGTLGAADVTLIESVASRIEELAGPAEPPARIHGDCWSGNVLWSEGRGWLIDPAAHGGHRETDLAMLALFGAPHIDRVIAAYQEVTPLAAGWQARVPLHQLHPLLVHVCLFGGSYRESALAAARAALAAA